MQSKNWHERKKAFAGACTVFRVLSDGQIKEALDALSDDIRNVETKHVADAKFTEYLLNLAHVLSHYTSTLTSDQVTAATTLVVQILDQLRRTGVPSELLDLARGIALVAEKTRCDRAFAILVFGALKYPLAPREPLVNVVRSRFPRCAEVRQRLLGADRLGPRTFSGPRSDSPPRIRKRSRRHFLPSILKLGSPVHTSGRSRSTRRASAPTTLRSVSGSTTWALCCKNCAIWRAPGRPSSGRWRSGSARSGRTMQTRAPCATT